MDLGSLKSMISVLGRGEELTLLSKAAYPYTPFPALALVSRLGVAEPKTTLAPKCLALMIATSLA